jgi:hypothetical protein
MQSFLTRPGRPALRQGLIFGVALGIIEVVFSYIGQVLSLGNIGTLIAYLLYVVFGLIAGLRASEQTGKVSTGVASGLWTGLFSSLVSSIVSIVFTLANLSAITRSWQDNARTLHQNPSLVTSQTVLQLEFFVLAIVVILALLLGLVGGAIGGYIGRNRANIPTQEYQETYFAPPSNESTMERPEEKTSTEETSPTETTSTE